MAKNDSNNRPIQAVVLAGGKGTRLLPLTELIPKPLIPVRGMPVLEIVLRQLQRFGFTRTAITLGTESQLIEAHFSTGEHMGLDLTYTVEQEPLGTVGPLTLVENLDDNFLVLNGDLLTTLDLRCFFDVHCRNESLLTIAAHERDVSIEFGIIEGQNERVTGYREKPSLQYRVSMGIYAFNRRIIDKIPHGKRFDLPDLVHVMLGEGEPVNYHSFSGYWLDIGSHNDYDAAIMDFPQMRGSLLGEEE